MSETEITLSDKLQKIAESIELLPDPTLPTIAVRDPFGTTNDKLDKVGLISWSHVKDASLTSTMLLSHLQDFPMVFGSNSSAFKNCVILLTET